MSENDGRFKKGVSGNPKGRPRGTGKHQRVIAQEEFEAIQRKRLMVAIYFQQRQQQLIDDYINCNGAFPAMVLDNGKMVEEVFSRSDMVSELDNAAELIIYFR
jgi:hypothetical protein